MGKKQWKRKGEPLKPASQAEVDRVLRLIAQVRRTRDQEAPERPSEMAQERR